MRDSDISGIDFELKGISSLLFIAYPVGEDGRRLTGVRFWLENLAYKDYIIDAAVDQGDGGYLLPVMVGYTYRVHPYIRPAKGAATCYEPLVYRAANDAEELVRMPVPLKNPHRCGQLPPEDEDE